VEPEGADFSSVSKVVFFLSASGGKSRMETLERKSVRDR
jgi:hypothetical protein